jgi:tetraacyldisaccharide 4'-kinase
MKLERRLLELHGRPVSTRDGRAARLLEVLSRFYGGIAKLRADLFARGILKSERLSCRVVSIGNLAAGGTGKTPMAIHAAGRLRESGLRVAILSRGYRGGAERCGGIVSDGRSLFLGPADAGDEPVMTATLLPGVPVAVGRDRRKMGRMVIDRFAPDVLVLDDGFQHLRLGRDLDLVLLDGRNPFGNGALLPRGALREPVSAVRRGDAVILTRCGPDTRVPPELLGMPFFRSRHRTYLYRWFRKGESSRLSIGELPEPAEKSLLKGIDIFAFSGIAGNADFRKSAEALGGKLAGFREFPDHHPFSPSELAGIERTAKKTGAKVLVTTHKDFVRFPAGKTWEIDLVVLGVMPVFINGEEAFRRLLAGGVHDPPIWNRSFSKPET